MNDYHKKTTKEEIGSYIDQAGVVSLFDVVEDRGLVEAGEVGHVFLLVKLGRVHLLDVVFGDELALSGVDDLDFDLVAAVLLDGGCHEADALVRDPDELLLGPFCLGGGVVEGPAVDDQVLQVGVQPVDDFGHDGS